MGSNNFSFKGTKETNLHATVMDVSGKSGCRPDFRRP